MTAKQPKHVFISYVRENKDQVDRLCTELKKEGVKVWLDRKSIKPGARWKDAIREAIRQGDFFIACFSKEYTAKTKTHMNEELTLAIEELRQYASERVWFIPILLSECDIPSRSIGAGETLSDINWVPLYEDWNSGLKKILSVIRPIHQKIPKLIRLLSSKNITDRKEAAEALGTIGPKAKAAVPALIKMLKDVDEKVRETVIIALIEIGSAAVPALIKALTGEDEEVRETAAIALAEIGPDGMSAMIEALKGEDEETLNAVMIALAESGQDSKDAVPALIDALKYI